MQPDFHMAILKEGQIAPLLKREWGYWSLFCFSLVTVAAWEGAGLLIAQAFLNGGPAALLYGCIALGLGTSCIFASLAELASMQPMIGAQYVWTAQFSSRKYKGYASYVQGWITILAWQTLVPSIAYIIATDIRGIIIMLVPDYEPQSWHMCLIMIGLATLSCSAAILGKRSLPVVAVVAGTAHLLLFLAVVITLLTHGTRASDDSVWRNETSLGNWDNHGLSFCIGFVTLAFTLAGAEGTVHMAEEAHLPEITVPRVIISSAIVSVVTAFAFSIVLCYSITDFVVVLAAPVPLLEIYRQATSSTVAAVVLESLLLLPSFGACIIALISASRLTWAFARDGGFVWSLYLDRISPLFKVPVNAVIANTTFTVLVSLIILASPVAFGALISFCSLALYTSYFITIAIFLYHRLTVKNIAYGTWRLGSFGIPINIVALCFCAFLIAFLPFPLIQPVTWANMNYAGPIMGAILLGVTISWYLGARHHFKGPIVGVRIGSGQGLGGFTVFSREDWLTDDNSAQDISL